MAETASGIVEQIEDDRQRLGRNLADLDSRVRESVDWHTHYENHPFWFLGAALGGGLVLSSILVNGSNRNSAPFRNRESSPASASHGAISEIVDNVKLALVSFGIAKAKDMIGGFVPGFEDHLRQSNPMGPRPGRT